MTHPGPTIRLSVGPVVVYLTVTEESGRPVGIALHGNTQDVDPSMVAWSSLWAAEVTRSIERGAGRAPFDRALGVRCEPSGPCPQIEGIAASIPDAVARWVLRRYWP